MKLSIKNNTNISRTTAETSLIRALQFLRAVGSDPNIMVAMRQTGFDEAAQKQGWGLVLSAYAAGNGPAAATLSDAPLTEATTKVEDWQSAMFVRANAALRRLHPEQCEFVFDNLDMGSGIAAVPAVATFLDRLDALESGDERKASRKADHAALATLEQRGVTKESRKEMRALVKWIESTPAKSADAAGQQSPRDVALQALYEWVQDWSECARTVVKRRDQLIRLGVGKRRSRKSQNDAPPATSPMPTIPAPAPVVVTPVIPPPPPAPVDTTSPTLLLGAPTIRALPPKSNGAVPGSIAVPDHA